MTGKTACFKNYLNNNTKGFTLLELMISVAIGAFILASIYIAYNAQHKSYITQEQVSSMQQNIRAAMYFMERDLRNAGLERPDVNGSKTWNFRVTDIRYRDLNYNNVAPGNNNINFSSIQFCFDDDDSHTVGSGEDIVYAIFDVPVADGNLDLGWNANGVGNALQVMAENVEGITFAYAYDEDNDGQLDFRDNNGNGILEPGNGDYVVWAIDSDNDNDLDFDLDTDNDGQIDWQDMDPDGNGVIEAADDRNNDGDVDVGDFLIANPGGSPLPGGGDRDLKTIRSVRIWLMARTDRACDDGSTDTAGINGSPPHFLGDRAIVPALDPNIPQNFKRRILTTIIYCRNLGAQS